MKLCDKLGKKIADIKELPEVMDYLDEHDMAVYESAIEHVVQVLKGDAELEKINYEREHRKLWNWLARNPEKGKQDYFDEYGFYECEIPANECFACEATLSPDGKIRCNLCPLVVAEKGKGCLGGLYQRWIYAKAVYERRRKTSARSACVDLARQIAELPWRNVEVQNE